MATYVVEFCGMEKEETVEASHICESKDGTWLILEDDAGEVRRYQSRRVSSVKRTSE